MKRSDLKKLIQEVYQRKLKEFEDRMGGSMPSPGSNDRFKPTDTPKAPDSKPASKGSVKYGYIAGETEKGVPIVQVIGYGKLTMDQVKNSIVDQVSFLIKYVRAEKYEAALGVLEENGLLKLFLRALDEIGEGKEGLKEDDIPSAPAVPQPTTSAPTTLTAPAAPQMSPANQQKLAQIEQERNKAQKDLEDTKGKLAKLTKPFTDRINVLEKRIANSNIAADRIKKSL